MSTTWQPAPPGRSNLRTADLLAGDRICCCVSSCQVRLPRTRKAREQGPEFFCPEHHLRTAPSGPTYVFRKGEKHRNILLRQDALKAHPKWKDHRLGSETSEDALTWNVFVGLKSLGALRPAVGLLAGVVPSAEPRLILWGHEVPREGSKVVPWAPLGDPHRALEPRHQQKTEPDVILHVPGELLVVVEAKFGSSNPTLAERNKKRRRKRKPAEDAATFLARYRTRPDASDPLDRSAICSLPDRAVLEQLVRMAVFASWLGDQDVRRVLVNLSRRCDQAPGLGHPFQGHLRSSGPVEFRAASWEDLFPVTTGPLQKYLVEKSYHFEPAFQLGQGMPG